MFKTKNDVDKHVADILSKIKNESERNLRGFNFARHYYVVKEHETAKRYLAAFLSVREASAPAHKLMGQIYEQCGHLEKAVQSYKRSLELDDKQKDVVLKICELYCQLHVDPERARYWADRAEKLFPHSEIVFRLRERLVTANGEQNTQELEDLVTNELLVKPRDVNLRIKLLKLFLDTNRVNEACDHAIQVEKKKPYSNSIEWCYCLVDVFEAYLEEKSQQYNATVSQYLLATLDRLVQLSLDNTREVEKDNRKTGSLQSSAVPATTALQSFDRHLYKTCQLLNVPESQPWTAFLDHMQGQLFLHMATIVFKRVKQGHVNPKEASRIGAALFLAAYSFKPLNLQSPWFVEASAEDSSTFKSWHDEACFRLSQAGHVIIGMCHEDRSNWLGKVREQVSTAQSISKAFQLVFGCQGQRLGMDVNSYFANCALLDVMSREFPDPKTLQDYDFVAQALRSDSLHRVVWLALQQYNLKDKVQPTYNFTVFNGLQFSTAKLENPSPESLCLLDVEAFLYATVHCSALALDDVQSMSYFSPDVPNFLPANICDLLCTSKQHDWWHAAYSLFATAPSKNLGDLRRKLQHGIEVIRCIGLHGMDVNLAVHLAETFAYRASDLKTQSDDDEEHASEVSHLDARACLYWRAALTMLERLTKNLQIRVPQDCMFRGGSRELSTEEANKLIESGRFYLACQAMNEGNHEAAITAFDSLRTPFASYYQSLTFKKLAGEEFGNKARESITSEMRSRYIILLTRARDALYVTLDRIRGDKKHPLNQVLPQEIEDIETRLARIDPDTAQRHEFEAPSDDSLSTQDSEDPVDSSPVLQPSVPVNVSTPPRSMINQMALLRTPLKLQSPQQQLRAAKKHDMSPLQVSEHLRPSPERLDSQIRSLASWQDTLINIVVEQNKALLDTNNSIVEQLKQNKTVVEKLTSVLDEFNKRILASTMGGGRRRRRPNHRPQSSQVGRIAAATNDCQQSKQSYYNNEGEGDDDDEDEENFYDGYYYDEDDYADNREPENANFQYNRAFAPTEAPLQNNYPYGQTTGLHGTSTITYTPPTAGRMMPSQPGYPPAFYVAANAGSAQSNPATAHMQPSAVTAGAGNQTSYPPSFYVNPDASSVHGNSAAGRLPPTAQSGGSLMQGHVVPPAYYHPATMFTGLPFSSEGQKLPEFHFNVDLNASDENAGPMRANAAELVLPTAFAANESTTGGVLSSAVTSQSVTLTVSTSSEAAPAESIVSTVLNANCLQLAAAGQTNAIVPHAFQIALPPDAVLIPAPINYPSIVGVCASKPVSFMPSISITVVPPSKAATRVRRDTADSSDRSYHEEDSSGPDFKPVIPLPAEVETKTGEEDELVLFEDRAKLFRYVDKEWKERGIGTLKILHNEASGRVRVLMRRDQILKTCANHSILADMELSRMKNDEKTWLWAAQDFADGKVRTEKFCARFKSVDAWHLFKEKFELAKDIASRNASLNSSSKLEEVSPPAVGFGNKFLPKAGSWNCSVCMINNAADRTDCAACSTPNPNAPQKISSEQPKSAFKFGFGGSPAPLASSSEAAGNAAAGASPFPFKFGIPATSSSVATPPPAPPAFKFGFQTAAPITSKESTQPSTVSSQLFAEDKPEENRSGFVFGSVRPSVQPKPSGFVFGASPVNSESNKSAGEARNDESGEKFTLGGFSFKSAPVVKQVEKEDDEDGVKKSPNKDGMKNESEAAKQNPFAKFSFGITAANASSPKIPSFASCSVTAEDLSFLELSKSHANAEAYVPDPNFKGFDGKDRPVFATASSGEVGVGSPRQDNEEFEPTAEFKPVVPLPELISVQTGEEDEIKLFSHRARLYRYVTDTKEWKERGVGEIKLLKHAKTGRVRVLMRRDQVLKICANHHITESMKLEQMKTSDRAWVWIAHDFSDGKLSHEKFAVKFKDTETAASFRRVFEAAQRDLDHASTAGGVLPPIESNEVTSTTPPNADHRPLSEVFKPKQGSWSCSTCCVFNDVIRQVCIACETPKPGSEASKPLSELFRPKAGSWECAVCAVRNNEEMQACQACLTPNPSGTGAGGGMPPPPPSTFKFSGVTVPAASSSTPVKASGFTFGGKATAERSILKGMLSDCPSADPSNLDVTPPSQDSNCEGSVGFRFGTPQAFAFSFGGVRPKSPTKTPKSPVEDHSLEGGGGGAGEGDSSEADQEEGAEGEGDNIYFHPVIPLPDKVEVKTGEEEEDVLYCQRAKLHRLSDGEWKERGLGDFKILFNVATMKIRLLMRREQILKVCCNHNLTADMKFIRKDERSFMWFASDFSEGEVKQEYLAIRFKNSEIAEEFGRAIADAQQRLATGDTSLVSCDSASPSPANFSFKLDENQATKTSPCPFTFGGRFSNLSAVSSPSLSIFGVSSSSGPAKNDPPASASAPSKENTDVSIVSERRATLEQEARAAELMLPAGFYLYEQHPPCPGCRGCETDDDREPDSDVSIVWQKKLPSLDKVEKARALMLPATFYLYEDAPPCSGCRGCTDDLPLPPSSGANRVIKRVSFVETVAAPAPVKQATESEEENMFSNSKVLIDNVSFANVAQQQQTNNFLKPKPGNQNFSFFGAGSSVFGSGGTAKRAASKAAGEEQDGSAGEDDDNDDTTGDNEETSSVSHFEPVIPLPSLIEVVTGEENEEKVFCERCKLYRWDDPLKQWKERGVGMMKVLKNCDTGRFRLLMRRDQIHKIACNHALGVDLDFKPMGTSDTSVCWYATDFADEKPQLEKFAARFKNTELMKLFCSTIAKCQQELTSREGVDVSSSEC